MDSIKFAAFGDFGFVDQRKDEQEQPVKKVADLVNKLLDPNNDFIITTGDNSYNYIDGKGNTVPADPDISVDPFYGDYIDDNRFFPSLGNHDYTDGGGLAEYQDFFGKGGVQADGVEAVKEPDAVTGEVETGMLQVDVTESLQAWLGAEDPNEANKGWAILPTGNDGVDFDSADGTISPVLKVTFDPGGTSPPEERNFDNLVDTFIKEGLPDQGNPTAPSLNIDGQDMGGEVQALLRFENLFGPGQIPLDAEIISASLELNVTGSGDPIKFHRINQSWEDQPWEDDITWNDLDMLPRFYDFVQGPVHFFVLDSNSGRGFPGDQNDLNDQTKWLERELQNSTAPWKIVYFHHAPYTSTKGNFSDPANPDSDLNNTKSDPVMQLQEFEKRGATAVLAGHSHVYERVFRDANGDGIDLPYLVTGLGGRNINIQKFKEDEPVSGSVDRYRGDFGTMLVEATDTSINFDFYSIDSSDGADGLIDTFTITAFNDPVDTFIKEGLPDKENPIAPELNVDGLDMGGQVQALLRFDDLFDDIPSDAEITSATLKLNITPMGGGNPMRLHRMLESWNDTDDWNKFGNDGIVPGDEAEFDFVETEEPVDGMPLMVNVTESLQAWQAAPETNYGWAILPTGNNGVDFFSAEGDTPPQLTVTFEQTII